MLYFSQVARMRAVVTFSTVLVSNKQILDLFREIIGN